MTLNKFVKQIINPAIPFIGFILFGCASGPVTTEIDVNKNPVVQTPKNFQSPIEAIHKFSEIINKSTQKDLELKALAGGSFKALTEQQKLITRELNTTNKLKLRPGYSYEFTLESFCVHAGVTRPVKGDGFYLGQTQGAAKAWLPQILKLYKSKNIEQNDAQVLIWSLLSGSRFDELSFVNQKNILKIFPDAPVRFGNSLAEDTAKSYLLSQIPSEILSAQDQFDQYKNLLQDTKSKFSDLERILSPESSRTNPSPVGWLKHEKGYYIQLKSDGYQRVKVQIYAPENIDINTYFDPTAMVALPNEGQRLALSGYVVDEANQGLKDLTNLSLDEALFIVKHPLDALKIYELGELAKELTFNNMVSQNKFSDDKADAFRHFVWSSLIANSIGQEKAQEFLNAHENFPNNNPQSKEMDLYNNSKGVSHGAKYKGSDIEKDVVQEGKDKINNKELRWIK